MNEKIVRRSSEAIVLHPSNSRGEKLVAAEERRRFIRINTSGIIRYRVNQKAFYPSHLKDASVRGLRVGLHEEEKKGSAVDFEIYFPFDALPIKGRGKIVWVRPVSRWGIPPWMPEIKRTEYEAGVTIDRFEGKGERRFNRYLERKDLVAL